MTTTDQSVGRSGVVMAAGTLASRVTGLARASLLASVIGATGLTADAFSAGNSLPNVFYLLLAGGALQAVLVPQIIRARLRPDGEEFVNRIITLSVVVVAAVTALLTLLAPLIVRLYYRADDPAAVSLAVVFAVVCMPQVLFYGLYTVLGQVLNASNRFAAFVWAPAAANLVALAGLVVFRAAGYRLVAAPQDWTAPMVVLVAGTATLSIAIQAVVLVGALRRMGYHYRPVWGLRGHGLGEVSKVARWTFGSIVVQQLGLLVTSSILTRTTQLGKDAGVQVPGLTTFFNAQLMMMLPHGLVTVSLVTALYTRLSEAAAVHDDAAVMGYHAQGLRLPAVLLVPGVALVVATAPFVTSTFFFDVSRAGTDAIALVLLGLVVGVIPLGWQFINDRVFYAHQQTWWSFRTQCVVTGTATTIALLASRLPPERTAVVLASGQTAAYVVGSAVGFVVLRRQHGRVGLRGAASVYVRVGVPAVLTAVALGVAIRALLPHLGDQRGLVAIVQGTLVLGVAAVVELGVTWGVAHLLGVREVGQLVGPVARRVRGRRRG